MPATKNIQTTFEPAANGALIIRVTNNNEPYDQTKRQPLPLVAESWAEAVRVHGEYLATINVDAYPLPKPATPARPAVPPAPAPAAAPVATPPPAA
jgi:hypothetical protein